MSNQVNTMHERVNQAFASFTPFFNPLLANIPILYLLKTLKSQRFSGIFMGYEIGAMAGNGLNIKYYTY